MIKDYENMSDKDILDLITNNEEGGAEGVAYLLYNRSIETLKYNVWRCFDSLELLDELINGLYIYISENDWHYLRGFRLDSSFTTWISKVSRTFFLSERKKMIAYAEKNIYIDGSGKNDDSVIFEKEDTDVDKSMYRVIMMEAISKLKNKDYRFIIIKTLQGYKSEDIAKMLTAKDKEEGIVRMYRAKEVKLDADYVNMTRKRAMEEVKKIAKQIEKEWDYENN